MATIKVSKDFNGSQLIDELTAAGHNITFPYPSQTDDELTIEGDLTDQQLADALDAHTPDPDFGKPAEELILKDEISQRLQTLHDATKDKATWDGLTAAQRQEVTRLTIQGFVKVVRFVAKRFL